VNRRTAIVPTVAALRCLVGAGLIGAPGLAGASPTSVDGRAVLMRTIGIRDVVVGAGTLAALRRDPRSARLWAATGLVSDIADVVLALGSFRQLGARGTLIAAMAPVPFIAAVGADLLARQAQL
jgi:hypothetical protein